MWKIILICGMFAALIAPSAASAQGEAQVQDSVKAPPSDSDMRMARFFAGMALIRSAPLASDAERARFYRELEAVCGVTGEDASVFLERCRSNPAEWKRISDLTIPILTELSVVSGAAPRPRAADRKKGKLLWLGQGQ